MKRSLAITIIVTGGVIVLSGLALGQRAYKNDGVHRFVEAVDPQDRHCRKVSVAAGSGCPSGCLPRPLSGPEKTGNPTECRSALWVMTCDTDCAPRPGLVRLNDGRFAESDELIVRLSSSRDDHQEAFSDIGIDLESGISGLFRYRARFENPDDDPERLKEIWERLAAIEDVVDITYAFE